LSLEVARRERHEIVVELEEHRHVREHDVVGIERNDVGVDADGESAALLRRLPPGHAVEPGLEKRARRTGDRDQAEEVATRKTRGRSIRAPSVKTLLHLMVSYGLV